jgi:amino acid permease
LCGDGISLRASDRRTSSGSEASPIGPESPVIGPRHGADRVDSTTSLHRVLGLVEVTAGGVGIIIGAGIYVLLGAATAEAGPLVWVAFLGAAVLSALTGLSYAELSSMFPSAAGEYEYTRQAMPE